MAAVEEVLQAEALGVHRVALRIILVKELRQVRPLGSVRPRVGEVVVLFAVALEAGVGVGRAACPGLRRHELRRGRRRLECGDLLEHLGWG